MKPIIGISADCSHEPGNARTHGKITLNWNYTEAIVAAGGVPILIPPTADMREVAGFLHGWLIPGGEDIDAKRFGQENHPACSLQDPARFEAEQALYNAAPKDLPILGICYGMQFLNVVRGGTLLQHVPDAVGHEEHHLGTNQRVDLRGPSRLATETDLQAIEGSSWHHQAIADLGTDLKVTALAPDGIVEAIEDADHPFFLGVQWHPERTPEDPATQRLMLAFVAAARTYAAAR